MSYLVTINFSSKHEYEQIFNEYPSNYLTFKNGRLKV